MKKSVLFKKNICLQRMGQQGEKIFQLVEKFCTENFGCRIAFTQLIQFRPIHESYPKVKYFCEQEINR